MPPEQGRHGNISFCFFLLIYCGLSLIFYIKKYSEQTTGLVISSQHSIASDFMHAFSPQQPEKWEQEREVKILKQLNSGFFLFWQKYYNISEGDQSASHSNLPIYFTCGNFPT